MNNKLLSLSPLLALCLSVCLCTCLRVCLHLSTCLCVCLIACLCVYLRLSTCLSLCQVRVGLVPSPSPGAVQVLSSPPAQIEQIRFRWLSTPSPLPPLLPACLPDSLLGQNPWLQSSALRSTSVWLSGHLPGTHWPGAHLFGSAGT